MIGTWNSETRKVDISWHELSDAWRATAKGTLKTRFNGYKIAGRAQWNRPDWQGFQNAEADKWLEEGYKVPGMSDELTPAPTRVKRRIRNAEEGDLDYGAFLTGAENPFSLKSTVKAKGGIDIEGQMCFSSATNPKVIQEYLLWLNQIAYSIEAQGSDVAIRLFYPGGDVWNGSGEIEIRVTVKKAGEWLDPKGWSPILSPAGFRGYFFLAIILAAETAGHKVNSGLGYCNGGDDWDVTFEGGILRIVTPATPYDFPEAEMTAKVLALLADR